MFSGFCCNKLTFCRLKPIIKILFWFLNIWTLHFCNNENHLNRNQKIWEEEHWLNHGLLKFLLGLKNKESLSFLMEMAMFYYDVYIMYISDLRFMTIILNEISIYYFVDLIFFNLPIKIYKLVVLFKPSHNLISQCNYNLDEIFYSFCATFIILLYLLFVKYVIWWNFVAFLYIILFGYLIKRKHNIRNT